MDTDGYTERSAAELTPEAYIESEAEAYTGNHAMIGAFALDAWKLPESIVMAIRMHHLDPTTVEEKLGRVVIAGEALARSADENENWSHEPARDPAETFHALGLTAVSIEMLVRRTAEEAEALDAVLGAVR